MAQRHSRKPLPRREKQKQAVRRKEKAPGQGECLGRAPPAEIGREGKCEQRKPPAQLAQALSYGVSKRHVQAGQAGKGEPEQ